MNFMPFGTSSEVKFEIGHVLFIDIVGYSKLLINADGRSPRRSRAEAGVAVDNRGCNPSRRHCKFCFLATRETENICARISDSRKIDRCSTLRESKPRL